METGLRAAVIAWNGLVAGMSDTEIAAVLRRELGPQVDALELVRGLAARKQRLFAEDQRFICDVRTQQTGERVHVMAASGLAR